MFQPILISSLFYFCIVYAALRFNHKPQAAFLIFIRIGSKLPADIHFNLCLFVIELFISQASHHRRLMLLIIASIPIKSIYLFEFIFGNQILMPYVTYIDIFNTCSYNNPIPLHSI